MGIKDIEKRKIGWMGGSFNPIHYGHMLLAETAREVFKLEKVLFIPNGFPGYFKKEKPIPAEHRLEMVKLATQDHPQFGVSDIEIGREEPCYSIDTLHLLKEIYPTQLFQYFFISGLDAIRDLTDWRDPIQVLEITEFIVGSRPGYSKDKVIDKIKYIPGWKEKVHFIDIPLLEISSSDIRERVRLKKSIRYLVPDDVIAYIYNHNLYM